MLVWGSADYVSVFLETVNLAWFGVVVLIGEICWVLFVWCWMRKSFEKILRRREVDVRGILDSWNES
jgi:hypothetical protein